MTSKMKPKKAAMFGIEGESLRKQSGELFLARLQRLTFRLVEGHQARWPLNSKGAMFGLDARIALAIFGALSVITGAALYTAIQKSRMVAIITTLEEHIKAVEAYLIDTGQNIPPDPEHSPGHIQIGELLISTAPGWKGPYLQYSLSSLDTVDWDTLNSTANPLFLSNSIQLLRKDGWANLSTPSCIADEACIYFIIAMPSNFSLSFVKSLDLLVDGNDTPFTGKFRYQDWGSNGTYSIYFMGPTAF